MVISGKSVFWCWIKLKKIKENLRKSLQLAMDFVKLHNE